MADIEACERGSTPRSTDARGLALLAKAVPSLLCAAVSLVHVVMNTLLLVDPLLLACVHFASLCVIAPFSVAARRGGPISATIAHISCWTVALATLVVWARQDDFYDRGLQFDTLEMAAVVIVIVGAMERTRRTAGIVVSLIIALFLSYALFWGRYLDGPLGFPGLSIETVLFRSVYTDEGMFGSIAGISASYVFMFVLFGAFLVQSGAGDFILALSRRFSKNFTGGAGFVAVFASAMTGTVSGSAVANTVSTGVVTIPLMKRSGFSPQFAGAVEATASTGGQLMPPVMGAGAFLIASYTQIPYASIVAVSIVPALLFFAAVLLFVRIEAVRAGLKASFDEDEQPFARLLVKQGASFILPIGFLIVMMVLGFTPVYAAGAAILVIIASSWLTERKMGWRQILRALESGARNAVLTGIVLVSIGLVVNVISMTGVGTTFSMFILEWSSGSLLLALLLVAIASLVLGVGLPVTASYVVLATLCAPAIAQIASLDLVSQMLMGTDLPGNARALLMLAAPGTDFAALSPAEAREVTTNLPPEIISQLVPALLTSQQQILFLLAAHLAIFWLSQDSNVTPPVCLTAFAGAAIALAPPMRTGVIAWKLAKGIYIVPLLFFFTPILSGTLAGAVWGGLVGLFAILALAISLEGFFERPVPLPMRISAGALGIALMLLEDPAVRLGAMALLAVSVCWLIVASRRELRPIRGQRHK